MNKVLDPIVSEFPTQEEADAYDLWFKAKVKEALDDPRTCIAHDQAMSQIDALIAQIESAPK
jgi:hypothetical protein